MKREIIWTAAAEADAQAWHNSFERRSDAAAERWANELIVAVERLKALPEMAPRWRTRFAACCSGEAASGFSTWCTRTAWWSPGSWTCGATQGA